MQNQFYEYCNSKKVINFYGTSIGEIYNEFKRLVEHSRELTSPYFLIIEKGEDKFILKIFAYDIEDSIIEFATECIFHDSDMYMSNRSKIKEEDNEKIIEEIKNRYLDFLNAKRSYLEINEEVQSLKNEVKELKEVVKALQQSV